MDKMTSVEVKEDGKSQLLMTDDKLISCGQIFLTNKCVSGESVWFFSSVEMQQTSKDLDSSRRILPLND